MRNFVQKGAALDVLAPSGGVLSGVGFMLGILFLVAAGDAEEGALVAAYRTGVFDLDAEGDVSGQDGTVGEVVYFDVSEDRVTMTATGNVPIGVLAADKATAATTARVVLVPRLSIASVAIAALTEASGAIGGTNNGDLPNIGTVSASPTQAEVTAIRDAVREVAAKLNAIIALF